MTGIDNIEWLNTNSGRAYPFSEDCGRAPTGHTGTPMPEFAFPNAVVVDFTLTVPGGELVSLYMGNVAYVGNLLTLVFNRTDTGEQIASVTLDINTHTERSFMGGAHVTRNPLYKAYPLAGTGTLTNARGVVVIGELTRLPDLLPQGAYKYAPDQTLLEPTTITAGINSVSGFIIKNGAYESQIYQGVVRFVSGRGVVLGYDQALNGIRVSMASPDECDCEPPLVLSINGISTENVEIVGDECVTVVTEGNRVIISDTCSTPCCGCEEAEYLAEAVKVLETSITNIEKFIELLDAKVDAFYDAYTTWEAEI